MKLNHDILFPKIEGIKFYLAGGAVRDLLMGKVPKDEDYIMLTDFTFEEVVQKLQADPDVKVYQIKPQFQIILIGIRNGKKFKSVDLAFPRKESSYTDGRRPDYTERTSDLKEDASRRDFTINAMFMGEDGEILDFFGGIDDIELEEIRCVGVAEERFEEDALRILRAMRFSVMLDFDIAIGTYLAMVSRRELLERDTIVIDRMREEINKMLKHDMEKGLKMIVEHQLSKILKLKDPECKFMLVQSGVNNGR